MQLFNVVAQHNRRIVSGVHILQLTRDRIEDRKEESCIAIAGRSFKDQPVDVLHQPGQVAGTFERHPPQRRAQTGHEQGGGDTFTRDVANCQSNASVFQLDQVVVIATDTFRRTACSRQARTGKHGDFLRKQPLLHLARNLHFTMHALPLRRFVGQRMYEFADFQRQSGLRSHGLQQTQVRR